MAFKKGQSGNPKGRAVVTEQQKRVASELLSPYVDKAVEVINTHLNKVDDPDGQRWAVGIITSYVFGKPKQEMDLTTQGNKIGILYVGSAPKPE